MSFGANPLPLHLSLSCLGRVLVRPRNDDEDHALLSMESWGLTWIVRSSRDTSPSRERTLFTASYTQPYASPRHKRGSCPLLREGEKKKPRQRERERAEPWLKRGMEFLLFQIFDSFEKLELERRNHRILRIRRYRCSLSERRRIRDTME